MLLQERDPEVLVQAAHILEVFGLQGIAHVRGHLHLGEDARNNVAAEHDPYDPVLLYSLILSAAC